MKLLPSLVLLVTLAACSPPADDSAPETAETTAIPVEPDGGIGDGAAPLADDTAATLEASMPSAIRGRWHKDDLGHAPTAADCDPYRDGTRDYDRLITVREGGYSYFETGGRIMQVHARSDSMIDATFDTTYADTPTSARREFVMRADGSLTVHQDGGASAEYLRCPAD